MSTVTEKELKKYYKYVGKSISASSKEQKEMLRGLQNGIEEYIAKNPNSTLEDIHTHFGKPEEVAAEYMPDMTPKDIKRFTRKKKMILSLSLVLAAIIILFVIVYFSLVWKTPGIIKETEKFEEPTNQVAIVENY